MRGNVGGGATVIGVVDANAGKVCVTWTGAGACMSRTSEGLIIPIGAGVSIEVAGGIGGGTIPNPYDEGGGARIGVFVGSM